MQTAEAPIAQMLASHFALAPEMSIITAPMRKMITVAETCFCTMTETQTTTRREAGPQGHRYNGVDARTTTVKTGAAMIALKAGVPVLPVNIKIKDNKHRFGCRKEVIIGKPITPEEMNYDPDAPGEYQRVADYLFERLCELGD